MVKARDAEILRVLALGPTTARGLAASTGINRTAVDKRVSWLREQGMVGADSQYRGRTFNITDAGKAARAEWVRAHPGSEG